MRCARGGTDTFMEHVKRYGRSEELDPISHGLSLKS